MSTTIGEFALNLIVDAGNGELTLGNLVKSMGALEVASVGEIALLGTLANRLQELSSNAIEHALSLSRLTDTTNESAESFEYWGRIANVIGLDAHQVQSAMKTVDDIFSDINFSSGAAAETMLKFNKLGMSLDIPNIKSGGDLFKAIRADKFFRDLDTAGQASLLRLVGAIPESLTPLLSTRLLTPTHLTTIESRLGPGMTDAERKHFKDVNEELKITQENAKRLGEEIALYFTHLEVGLLTLATKLGKGAGWMIETFRLILSAGEQSEKEDRELDRRLAPVDKFFKNMWSNLQLGPENFVTPSPATGSTSQQQLINLSFDVHVPITTKADPAEIFDFAAHHSRKAVDKHFGDLFKFQGVNAF